MNHQKRGKGGLPVDHHSMRLRGPDRKQKHKRHWLDTWQDAQDERLDFRDQKENT